MTKWIFLILFIIITTENLSADDKTSLLRQGNKLYKDKKFNDAEIKYRKAQEIEYGYKSTYNLGDALFRQGNYDEAAQKFKEVTSNSLDKNTLAAANHNLGNSLLKSNKFEESINAYKNALKLNPKDEDTRYNLELAKRMLKIQQQEKQNQDKNQDKNKKDDKNNKQDENKQNSDDQKQNQDKNQDNKQDNNKNDNQKDKNDKDKDGNNGEEKPTDKPQDGQSNPKPQQISKSDAERMLNALQNEEKNLQKKLRKQKGERAKIEKNW